MSARVGPAGEAEDRVTPLTTTQRVAVVGLGRAGVAHVVMLSHIPGCELVAVADPRAAARAALHGMGFVVPSFARIEPLLEQHAPDAVVVCAAQHERAAVARAAIEAGVPVLVERPMARTLAEAEELVALARTRGVSLAVGHPLAHEPVFARVHELVRAGALGQVRQARSAMFVSRVFAPRPRRGPGWLDPARVAGGVVAHLASDLLFVLVRMLGMPAQVRAERNAIYGEVEDELHAMMTLPDGGEVGFDCSWSVPGYVRASTVIELAGREGRLLASDEALEVELSRAAAGLPAGYSRQRDADFPAPARFDYGGETLWLHDAAFLDWLAGGAAPPNQADAALEAHRVMDALYRSAAAGGATVEVTP
jgi:predicted dehydrogenase